MSSITFRERALLEDIFEMGGGYVSDFSNFTFDRFFVEHHVNIYEDKYGETGGSKAKRLREYWRLEDDHSVGVILKELIEHERDLNATNARFNWSQDDINDHENKLLRAEDIVTRLLSGQVSLGSLKAQADSFDAAHLKKQIKRIEQSIEDDPDLAIGTAKELIETTCKTILRERGKPVSGSPDISNLTKDTLRELRLVPEGIPDEARGKDVIKRLLSNLGTIGNGLAELRGMYGTGHGKDANSSGLQPRHARLAVGSATTLAMFLFDTHKETRDKEP